MKHLLCGTCLGEFKRQCGYFESDARRGEVLHLQELSSEDAAYNTYVCCCNCGSGGPADASFELSESSRLCDGNHDAS